MQVIHFKDFYKTDHGRQYPAGTTKVYSNFTARISRMQGVERVVVFGIADFIEQLKDLFEASFFSKSIGEVTDMYQRRMDTSLGKDAINTEHFRALHKLGYLPLEIKALDEGTLAPLKVPILTITNTHPDFAWLPNFLETWLSCSLWHPITSATIAFEYRKVLEKYARDTSDIPEFVKWQGHDFSMRGHVNLYAAFMSGAAHLLSFTGTDTITAIDYLEGMYEADSDKELIGGSVPATEHAVMCLGGQETEFDTYRRLITEVYPKGIVSIVSDTWNFWNVLTNTLPKLKDQIMARDGKVVIRPDSGDPETILCGIKVPTYKSLDDAKDCIEVDVCEEADRETGDHCTGEEFYTKYAEVEGKIYAITIRISYDRHDKRYYYIDSSRVTSCEEALLTPEQKGALRLLWETFGGSVNSKGFKQLDPHIGLIYGDSITLERCKSICARMKEMGFASTNMVFGIGSYTYQYVTRDTFGFAMKATYGEINGQPKEIFKDPLTDGGVKKSAKGLLRVNEDLTLSECVTKEEEKTGLLKTVFLNGEILSRPVLSEIRAKIDKEATK